MYCQRCGDELRDNTGYCDKCGSVTGCNSSVTGSILEAQSALKWQSYWKAIIVGMVFLIVLVGAGIFYTRRPVAQPKRANMHVNLKDKAEMVWVPSGNVVLDGIDRVGNDAARQVTIPGFWIYKYEVTIAQYRSFCAATSHSMPPWPGNCFSWAKKTGWSDRSLQKHPIVNVTWYDAKAYADWAKVALPTELQWEYAARGPERLNYPWGGNATTNDPYNGWDQTKCANAYNSISQKRSTWPVGSFPAGASWCNVNDLAGNVWEWCAEQNHESPKDAYVLRGGSWASGQDYCRSMRRMGQERSSGNLYFGFRCVLSTSHKHPQPQ